MQSITHTNSSFRPAAVFVHWYRYDCALSPVYMTRRPGVGCPDLAQLGLGFPEHVVGLPHPLCDKHLFRKF